MREMRGCCRGASFLAVAASRKSAANVGGKNAALLRNAATTEKTRPGDVGDFGIRS